MESISAGRKAGAFLLPASWIAFLKLISRIGKGGA
jgi:hypothetical protein